MVAQDIDPIQVSSFTKPLVQANGLVDLRISRQSSEARPGAATSFGGSPAILDRQIGASLTLEDGGSLVMGGLFPATRAPVSGGPVLGRMPVLERLFRTHTLQRTAPSFSSW